MSESSFFIIERLDQYVNRQLPKMSRSSAAHLIEQGNVTVNGVITSKASYKVRGSDIVKIDYNPNLAIEFPIIELPIIYEDKTCVVINKPAGILSHSKGAFNPEPSVASWLVNRLKGLSGDRAGIVHRLDRATSGLMICAKTPQAMIWLQRQFSQRKVKKTYIAVVKGIPDKDRAIIDMPIERNPKKPQTFRVGSHGKSAITEYRVLQSNNTFSLLELIPTTGRTHQLRVHLHRIGHPIVGDIIYGGMSSSRLFLHSKKLEIVLPNKKNMVFNGALPPEFLEIMK